MQHENELQERSVLDEIRSTIASLDAIRGRETATYQSASATSVVDVAPAPTEKTIDAPSAKRSVAAVDESLEQLTSFEDVELDDTDAETALQLARDG